MRTVIESVPNISEGRDRARVEEIAAAVRAVPGARLLDVSSDASHNRSVLTLVGDAAGVAAAIRALFEAALPRIDLTKHAGEHPRMGAVDVVPFIPIRGVNMEQCLAIAKETAREIAERFQVPIYLYERAATRPDRTNLENVRRGQFEGLRDEIGTNPDRKPDYGPARIHPTAGATAVGVRKFLIAYNINLSTSDVG